MVRDSLNKRNDSISVLRCGPRYATRFRLGSGSKKRQSSLREDRRRASGGRERLNKGGDGIEKGRNTHRVRMANFIGIFSGQGTAQRFKLQPLSLVDQLISQIWKGKAEFQIIGLKFHALLLQ